MRLQVGPHAVSCIGRLTKELLALNNVVDIGLFAFMSLTLLLSLLVVQTVLSVQTLLLFVGWVVCGVSLFRRLPRWTRSRPGVRKLLNWMVVRLCVLVGYSRFRLDDREHSCRPESKPVQ